MVANKSLKRIIFIVIGFLIIFAIYKQIFNGFFQQDEWFSYGWFVIHKNLNLIETIKFVFYPNIGHYNPFTVAVQQFLFSVWGLNYIKFSYLGIVLHFSVCISLYYLSKRIFKNNLLTYLSVILFGVLFAPFQAVSWVVADIATLTATLFGIISTIYFFDFISTKKGKYIYFSLISLLVSSFFKEMTLGILPLFIGFYFLKNKKKIDKNVLILIGSGFLYTLFRGLMIFAPRLQNETGSSTSALSFSKVIYNFFTLPIKSVTYTIIPSDVFKNILSTVAQHLPDKLTGGFGSPDFDVFVVKRLMEGGSIFLGLVFIVVILIIYLKTKKENDKKFILIFGLIWTIINSFIFAVSPGTSGVIFVPDSRNLYFSGIGMVFVIITLLYIIFGNKKKLFLIIFSLFLVFNMFFLSQNLNNFTQLGKNRQIILTKIKSDYPVLQTKQIFYTESDTSFYGLAEDKRIMPFQSGFGQVLLSWYENSQKFPNGFFMNDFLWNIDSQGYKEINDVGFGYFRNFSDLANFVKINNFDENNIIAYSYNSNTDSLSDISDEIKGRLEGFEAKKRIISQKNMRVSSSAVNQNLSLALDQKENTFWDSGVKYIIPQNVVVDLGKVYSIAEVSIDAFNNQNQNNVGYQVFISKNKEEWLKVFESKKYPPDSNGSNKLYFKPTNGRYVRIEQIGSHKYADWVISELNVYEKN